MSGDSLLSQIGVVFGTILGIVFILYLAYISTKIIGKRYSVKTGGGKKIKIIDSAAVGKDNSLIVVRAGEKVFLVGTSVGNVNLISELDAEDFPEEDNETPAGMDFKTALKNVLENRFGKKNKTEKENEDDSSQEE